MALIKAQAGMHLHLDRATSARRYGVMKSEHEQYQYFDPVVTTCRILLPRSSWRETKIIDIADEVSRDDL